MKKRLHMLVRVVAGLILFISISIFVLSLLLRITDTHYNVTPSLPLGFYQVIDAPIGKGAYVSFCPPKRAVFELALERNYIDPGICPGGYQEMLKRVFASSGDTVSIRDSGVYINGQRLDKSAQMETDSTGAALPAYKLDSHVLTENEFLLMSDVNPQSFDARYFGLAERHQIMQVVRPVFTWESW